MIRKLGIRLRNTSGISFKHNSREDCRKLAEACNILIDKVNELIEKINELEGENKNGN